MQTGPGFQGRHHQTFAILSDVCEVSEDRREKETGPFLPDKMMQVFVKGRGSTALLQLLSLVCAHTHTHTHTHSLSHIITHNPRQRPGMVKALRVLMNPLHTQVHTEARTHTHTRTPPPHPFSRHFRQWRLQSVSSNLGLKGVAVCVWEIPWCVWKDVKVNLKIASSKRRKEIGQYFLSSVIVSIFPPFSASFLPDCVHLLIDNWLQSHSGLLKYQAGASGFRPRPRALPLSASGWLAPLEPSPSHSARLLCVPPPQPPDC